MARVCMETICFYAGGIAFSPTTGIQKSFVDYSIQQSWISYTHVSSNPTRYLQRPDVLVPHLMSLKTPRPIINYVGKLPWTMSPFYHCNLPVVFVTIVKNNFWGKQRATNREAFTSDSISIGFLKSSHNVWRQIIANELWTPRK